MSETAAERADPPPELLIAAYFDVHPGYALHRAMGAASWLVTWTTGGSGRLSQGGASVRTGPGDLAVLGPHVPHDYAVADAADRWAFWWVHCQARTSWQSWLRPYQVGERFYVVDGVPDAVRPRIAAAFGRLQGDSRWSGDGAPPEPADATGQWGAPTVAVGAAARELAVGAVEEIVLLATASRAAAARAASAPGARGSLRGPAVDPRIQRTEALMAADPAAPHTVDSLAAVVALSPSRFAHLFAEQTGRTPMRALRDIRLRHAARLLEATALPVASVARASGFVSAFHFSRAFRARFGVPPRDYREGPS